MVSGVARGDAVPHVREAARKIVDARSFDGRQKDADEFAHFPVLPQRGARCTIIS